MVPWYYLVSMPIPWVQEGAGSPQAFSCPWLPCHCALYFYRVAYKGTMSGSRGDPDAMSYCYRDPYNSMAIQCGHYYGSRCSLHDSYNSESASCLPSPLPHPTQHHASQLPLHAFSSLQYPSICCDEHALSWMRQSIDVFCLLCPSDLSQVC